jgi:hypothetical protein
MKTILLALLVVTGCVVGEGSDPGGGGGGGDGSGSGSGSGSANNQGTVDGGVAAACTGAAYDPCTDATQCTSGTCQLFQQSGFQVCSQTCTPGDATTCPMQNGAPQQCNNMGICKPAAANACTR